MNDYRYQNRCSSLKVSTGRLGLSYVCQLFFGEESLNVQEKEKEDRGKAKLRKKKSPIFFGSVFPRVSFQKEYFLNQQAIFN